MRSTRQHPVRLVSLAFVAVIGAGTLLLLLPISRAGDARADLLTAAFTAVSATCVTGLTVVDTATYWSPFGHAVLLGLVQIGGLGVMSMATLLTLLLFGRLGVHGTLVAQTDSRTSTLGDVRGVLATIALSSLALEAVLAAVLTVRFWFGYDQPIGTALWHGVFHSVSAFNNAGFALYSDNIISFIGDPWFILPLCVGIIAGGIGFPVYYELLRRQRPRRLLRRYQYHRHNHLSMHARLTLLGYFGLAGVSTMSFGVAEWSNPGTLGGLDTQSKVLGTIMGGVTPRTAGFNAIDYADAQPETLFLDSIMMFIGGGSAGTAGGIKVGTFVVLAFVIWAEVRGDSQVVIGHRAISSTTVRQALSVALLGVAAVVIGTMSLLAVSDYSLGVVLFESASAFGTTGLSTGITASFNTFGQLVLMLLMFVGRIGPITAATALALTYRKRLYRVPEERPIVG
jgi:trk system potassium uptake protein TrkH